MNETIKLECHAAGIIRLGTERSKGMSSKSRLKISVSVLSVAKN